MAGQRIAVVSGVLAALAFLPGAAACSLAAQDFESAVFAGDDLWYVEHASSLRRQHGALDTEVEDAFFLSFAVLPDEGLLIAGQEGLDADCTGLDWLELRRGGETVWRKERDDGSGDDLADATVGNSVISHSLGPFVLVDGRYWRLEGDQLAEVGRPTKGTWLLGFDAAGRPVETSGNDVYVGDLHLPLAPTGYPVAMAVGDGVTAIVERIDWRVTVVHLLAGDQASNVTWVPPEGWEPTAAWADALVVSAGSRAYRLTDQVVDLGVDGVVAVAARGEHTAVFTADGYIVFAGTVPIERWTRGDGTWTPAPVPQVETRAVEATWSSPRDLPEGKASGEKGPGEDGLPIPSAGLLAVAGLAASALVRRRG